jgi:tetratricopeptide (TPR) repeat protein
MKQIDSAEVLLGMAEEEQDERDALWFARRARKLEPDNLDAERMVALYSAEDEVQLMKKLETLIHKGDQWLEENGYMDGDKFGHYLEYPETMPYLRLRYSYCKVLEFLGIYGKAAAEAEEIMWLCPEDDMELHYSLIHFYAALGEEDKAKDLCEKYCDEPAEMLLPMSILCYRKGNLKSAQNYLEKMLQLEPGLVEFFKKYSDLGDLNLEEEQDEEEQNSRQMTLFDDSSEFLNDLEMTIRDSFWLYVSEMRFFKWGHNTLTALVTSEARKQRRMKSRELVVS